MSNGELMRLNVNALKLAARIAVISLVAIPAWADPAQQTICGTHNPGGCVQSSFNGDQMNNSYPVTGPFGEDNDPACASNLPNCYTYYPSRDLTQKNPAN